MLENEFALRSGRAQRTEDQIFSEVKFMPILKPLWTHVLPLRIVN